MFIMLGGCAAPAAAGYDDSSHLARILDCMGAGDDVRIELFLPNAVVYQDGKMNDPKVPVNGYFILDLEKLGKGKSMEPVKVWRDDKAKAIVVTRYSRGMAPTRVALNGGVVDFDDRFAEGARCKPYDHTREDESAVPYPPARPIADEPAATGP